MTQPQDGTRDAIRAKIFGAKPKSELVENFFGTTIEIRQPTLQVALEQRNTDEKDRLYFMLTDYAYVPETNEKVFEKEDIDNIRNLPFGPEFNALMDKINSLLGIKPEEVEATIADAEKSA
jgi:hypothetical protein